MDFAAVIKAPFEDPDWLKKLALMGIVNVLLCITVIGIFVGIPNLLGWGVTYARGRMNGNNTLPEFGFGYIGLGYRAILASLSLVLVMVVVSVVITIISMLLGKISPNLAMVGMILYLPFLVVLIPAGIAVNYRFVVHDDAMAGFRFSWILGFVMANLGTVLMAFVIMIVVGLISGAMGIVPIVGGMFGAAFSIAANNALVAEMAKATNRA